MLENVLIFLLGVIIGYVIFKLVFKLPAAKGTLKINKQNPDKDSYLFQIDDLESIDKAKYAIIKVEIE